MKEPISTNRNLDTILGPSQRWLDSSSSFRKDGSIPEALATSSYSSESHPGLLQTISSSCNASDDDNTTTIRLDDQPRFFIPGINGKARCLHSSHQELEYGRNSPPINHSTAQDTRFKHLLKSNGTSSKSRSFSSIYNMSSSSLALEKLNINKDKDEEHEDSINYLSSSHSKGMMFHGNTSLTLTTSTSTSVAYSTSTTDNQEDSIRSLDLHFQLMNPKPECKFPFLEKNYQPTANKRRTKKNQNEPKHENQQELEDQKEAKQDVDDKRDDKRKKRKKKPRKELLSDYLYENDRQFSSEKEKSKHRTLRRSTHLKTKQIETQAKIDQPRPKSQNRQRSSSNHERKPQKKRDPTSKLVQFRQSLASQSRRSVDDFDLVDRMYVARRRHASYQETTTSKKLNTQEEPPLRSFQSMVDRSTPTRPDIAPTLRPNLCDVMDIGYQSEEVLGSLRKRESQLDVPTNMTSPPMTKETHSPNTLGSLHFISVERTKTWDKTSSDVQSLTQTFHNSILKQYSQPLRNPPNVSNQLTTPRFQQSSMDTEKYSPPLYQNAPTSLLQSRRSKLATNKHVSPVSEEASLLSSCLDQDVKEMKMLDNSISNTSSSSPDTPLMPMDQLYMSFEKLGHRDWVATRCDTLKRLPSSAPTNMPEKNSFLTKRGQHSNPVLPSIPQITKNRPPKMRQELSHSHSDHQPREIQRMSNYKTTTTRREDGNSKKDTSRQSRSASCPKTRNRVGFSRDVPTTSLHENRRRSQSRHGKKRG